MIKLGIDGRALFGNIAGIGHYVFELCKELDKCLPNIVFFVYAPFEIKKPVLSKRWVYRIDNSYLSSKIKPVLWVKSKLGYICKPDNLDVFWAPSHFLPSLPEKIKTILTVHDLVYLICPKSMSFTHRLSHHLFFNSDIKKTNCILTNSQGTSDKLFNLLKRRADAIVYPGVNLSNIDLSQKTINMCKKHLGITSPYFLTVGTLEPRKNLASLVEAFVYLKDNNLLQRSLKLVLVGAVGWKNRSFFNYFNSLKRNDIISLGYVEDKFLPPLYSSCEAFIYPSLYEGFGMPVQEARAFGAKVVTTDLPELHEAGGENAIYISPDKTGILNGILSASKAKDTITNKGIITWAQSAKVLANEILKAIN